MGFGSPQKCWIRNPLRPVSLAYGKLSGRRNSVTGGVPQTKEGRSQNFAAEHNRGERTAGGLPDAPSNVGGWIVPHRSQADRRKDWKPPRMEFSGPAGSRSNSCEACRLAVSNRFRVNTVSQFTPSHVLFKLFSPNIRMPQASFHTGLLEPCLSHVVETAYSKTALPPRKEASNSWRRAACVDCCVVRSL